MPYLIVDPCDPYAEEVMEFLHRVGQPAVVVITTRERLGQWHGKWAQRLRRFVVDEVAVADYPSLAVLAAHLRRQWPTLSGIIPWDERHVLFGAELGERLDLGWNPRRVIERCRDKGVMKEWLARHGRVRVNASRRVHAAGEAVAFQRRIGRWPVVVKPTGGAGSTDVYFATDEAELLRSCQRVLNGGRGEVLLEEYVGGREYAVNGVVDGAGDLLATDVWLYDRRASHGIPNLYYQVLKVAQRDPIFEVLAHYAAAVVEVLELRRAPIHMEAKVDDQGPCLIEIGARFAGGNLPWLASKLHGRSIFELAACHYLADLPLRRHDIDYERYDRLAARLVSGIQSVALPRIQRVHGVREVEALPSFEGFGLLRPPGAPAPLTTDLDTTAYEVYLIHPDPAQVEEDATAVRQLLRYE